MEYLREELKTLYNAGDSLSDIAKQTNTSTTSIFRLFKKLGIKTEPKRRKKGALCNLWKGGRIIRNGYVLIKTYNHPNSNYGGYVREHILVMESHINRHLRKEEVVHHRNGVKTDNRLINLELTKDSIHKSSHAKIRMRDETGKFIKCCGSKR